MHKPQSTVKRSVGRRPKSSGVDEDTRADILAAARKVFALRGFAGTSIREVAEAARVNKAMIYYHFKDKVDLYRAVLSDSFDAMQDIWKHKIFQGEATARRKIQQYIEGFIRFQHDNEDLRKILAMEFSTTGTKSENLKWIAQHYFAKNHAALMKILEAGMKSGELKRDEPAHGGGCLDRHDHPQFHLHPDQSLHTEEENEYVVKETWRVCHADLFQRGERSE